MFNVMHPSRKYSATRFISDSPVPVAFVNKSPILDRMNKIDESPWEMSPPPSAKMRLSKGKGVKAVRRHPSPQPPSLESLEAAWNERTPLPSPAETGPDPAPNPGDNACPGRSSRKRGFRPDVRTIFSPREKDPRVREERGEGHTFIPGPSGAWCDVCCDYILHNCLSCAGCKYTCHPVCRDRVSLDCHPGGPSAIDAPPSSLSQDHLNNNHATTSDVEKERELRTHFSRDDIRHKIELYNASTTDHLKMTLNPNGLYTGFIKVQLELRRPVTVRRGEVGGEEAFYLPRGAMNTLHISSNNTVRQVIQALLTKFTVADNPAKYALYKRCHREEQVYVCRLAEGEHPLFLRLLAGPNTDTLGFVLREQQTGEVMWDAFSIPELRNFLCILEKEEKEQVCSVMRRYDNYRVKLQEALRATGGPG